MAGSAILPTGEFALHVGQSLQDSVVGPSYHSLRYDFKPASVNTEAPGSLTFGIDGQVSLDLLKKSGDDTGLAFTGYSESFEDGLDCVAIFDGMSWTLQLLSGALKVQHVKGPGRATPPPQAAPTNVHEPGAEQLQSSSMDAASSQAEAEAWSAREQSQEGSESQLPNGFMHSTVTPHDTNSDGETASEEGEAEPAHQQAPPAAARQPNGIAHQYTKGHAQSEAHLRHSDSSASEEEDDDDGQEEEEGGGAEAMQEADAPAAHVANGVPMTDLERQFFANSQPDDSSDSSSDSDQESMNAASEDDEDDGLDHF